MVVEIHKCCNLALIHDTNRSLLCLLNLVKQENQDKDNSLGKHDFTPLFYKVRFIVGDLKYFHQNDTFQSFISCLHNLLI